MYRRISIFLFIYQPIKNPVNSAVKHLEREGGREGESERGRGGGGRFSRLEEWREGDGGGGVRGVREKEWKRNILT